MHIPKACDTVMHSAAPLALRLQSNLLVGISRVYLQQFDYLYQDVANVHTNIKRFDVEKRLQNIDLPGRVEGRTEQLVLRDRPGFEIEMFPEFELDLTLDGMLGVEAELRELEERENDVFLTPRRYQQTGMPGSSPGSYIDGGFASSAGGRVSHLVSSPPLQMNKQYEGVLEDDPLFEFGEDGEMREVRRNGAQTPRPAADMLMSDDLAAQVMRELESGDQAQEVHHPFSPVIHKTDRTPSLEMQMIFSTTTSSCKMPHSTPMSRCRISSNWTYRSSPSRSPRTSQTKREPPQSTTVPHALAAPESSSTRLTVSRTPS